MSNELEQIYINGGGEHCSYCGSLELSVGDTGGDALPCWCSVECLDCGGMWTELIGLLGCCIPEREP
jgi:hypothetical protein